MNILDLAYELGLQPKRAASTNGGEYKSACPKCKDGKNRFCIWPGTGVAGTYWCRVCNCKGDAIAFCREFFGMTYPDACRKINVLPKESRSSTRYYPLARSFKFIPKTIESPTETWRKSAESFVSRSHENLIRSPSAQDLLFQRGLTKETIEMFKLGWNPETIFDVRSDWGLPEEKNEKGNEKKQWLPRGIVIPAIEQDNIVRIKIRRSDWHPTDLLPKYIEISGSQRRPSLYGDPLKPISVMESELDAILTQQFAFDLCCCLGLGGVGKRPDKDLHEILRKAPLILLSLDYDEAGKKEYHFWMSLYPNLRPWPPRMGKSPGDSYSLYSIDLRKWIEDGVFGNKM